jgi:hypothetical protein
VRGARVIAFALVVAIGEIEARADLFQHMGEPPEDLKSPSTP